MLRPFLLFAILTISGTALSQPRPSQSGLQPGEYRVEIIEVIDGDTFRIDAAPWIDIPELSRRVSVRVDGIDTPEKNSKACQQERDNAQAAAVFTKRMVLTAKKQVVLSSVKWDKYGGRILAKVRLLSGDDLSSEMIQRGYATPYKGSGPKTNWCLDRPR